MKRVLLIVSLLLFSTVVNAQITLAIMDFKPGSNMTNNLDGLSDMLINSLFDSGNYDIVERSQIEYALKELGIQGKNLSVAQLTKLGEYLKVDNVLVGTVNFIATGNSSDPGFLEGEYNIDVRIVNVKTSRVIATAGVVKSPSQTYRSLMPELARQLSIKLSTASIPCLEGYLYVYPEALQKGSYGGADGKIRHLNSISAFGRNNWRLPTLDEIKMILANREKIDYSIPDDMSIWSSEYVVENNRLSIYVCYWNSQYSKCSVTRKKSDEDDLLIIPVATD